jgi:hypothetical protein
MRRFRHRSGERDGRTIERMKSLIESQGASAVLDASARTNPRQLRPAAFAIAADLILVDGRMERSEARFLRALATALRLTVRVTDAILKVIRIKNSV